MDARRKEAALVLCLLLLAGSIALESEHLVPPVFGIKVVPVVVPTKTPGPSIGLNSKPGMLIIDVSSSLASGNVYSTPDVANASVSVVPQDKGPLFPTIYHTNSAGQLEQELTPDNYSVTVYDLPMNVSVPVEVHQMSTTVLRITITSNRYLETFLDIPTNESDVVQAWSHATIEVDSSVALLGSNTAFLDLFYSSAPVPASGQSGQRELQVPVLVTGSDVRSVGPMEDEWIAFQPEVPILLSGLTSVELSVFGAYANVTNYAGGVSGGISGGITGV